MRSWTTAWNRTGAGLLALRNRIRKMLPKNPDIKRVMVTGGAGYVGAMLVPQLLAAGYEVNVLDLYMYGADVLADARSNPGLREIKGDIRDIAAIKKSLEGCQAVI